MPVQPEPPPAGKLPVQCTVSNLDVSTWVTGHRKPFKKETVKKEYGMCMCLCMWILQGHHRGPKQTAHYVHHIKLSTSLLIISFVEAQRGLELLNFYISAQHTYSVDWDTAIASRTGLTFAKLHKKSSNSTAFFSWRRLLSIFFFKWFHISWAFKSVSSPFFVTLCCFPFWEGCSYFLEADWWINYSQGGNA